MNRTIGFAGLLLASLTISTVALAQQGGGGGGRGGDGGGNGGSGGGASVIDLLREDAAQQSLARAVAVRRANGQCLTAVCAPPPGREPPSHNPPSRQLTNYYDPCPGSPILIGRDDAGRVIRYVCQTL